MRIYVKDEPGALAFPVVKGEPLRRGNFNKMSAWPHAVESIGMPGLHFLTFATRATSSRARARPVSRISWRGWATIRSGPR